MAIRVKAAPIDPFTDEAFGNWVAEVEATLDFMSLKNVYFSETWLYIVVNIVGRKISRQPLTIERETLANGSLVRTPAERNSLIDLFDNPNEYEAYTSFMYKVASELTLMGNAIIWRLRFHRQLILIPTEIVRIETNRDGSINHYQVNFGSAREFQDIYDGYMRISPKDIIHIRLPHLNSMFWGLSPFIPSRKSLLFDKYTKEFLLNFYLKQANPGPIIELGELANEKQALRLLKSLETNWTGRRNQRRTMILPKGVTAKSLQQTMAEQQLKEHLLINRDDIRGVLAIPPHELGIQTTGSIGSNETKEQLKNFYEQTIIPFQKLIADEFSKAFAKELGPKTFFAFDNSDVSALQADESEKADVAIKQLNFMTVNEVRANIYDLPPVPGGDMIRGSQQQNPFGQFGQNFQLPQNQPAALPEPQEDDAEELACDEDHENPKGTERFLDMNREWWLSRKTKEDNEIDRAERKVLSSVLGIFADQAEIAVKKFRQIYKERLKADGFFPDEERLKDALNEAFLDFSERYRRESVPVLMGSSKVGYDIQLDVPFNLPSRDEIEALGAQNEEGRLESLAARAIQSFEGFNQTTTNDIVKTVQNGVESSKTLDEIASDIFKYFGEVAPNRSKTIARTETLVAVSLGQKAAEDDASTVIPGLKKMWITAGDGRVRSFKNGDATDHLQLDGEMVEVGKDFKTPAGNSLEFPRDPRGPANEVINCRCSWLIVPPEEKLDTSGIRFGEAVR